MSCKTQMGSKSRIKLATSSDFSVQKNIEQ